MAAMKAVVMFKSNTGNTRKAAEIIGGELADRGIDVVVRPVDGVDFNEIAEADFVCVGTWVDGIILFGHRPGSTGALLKSPMLWDKPVGAFMTYALHAGNVMSTYETFLREEMGADVIGGLLMKRGNLGEGVDKFVDHILGEMERAPGLRTSGIY